MFFKHVYKNWMALNFLQLNTENTEVVIIGQSSSKNLIELALNRAPKLWNSLPVDIRSSDCLSVFKGQLKTYLYRCAFNML